MAAPRLADMPRRSRWLLSLCATALLPLAALPRSRATAQPAPEAPNVLVIVTDDQRAEGTMGVLGETRRLFRGEGIRFSKAIATTPSCCPARASIFTGQYAHNHGVLTNQMAEELDHDTTVQAALRAGGYRTAIVGKFLNGWDLLQDPPHFDRWAIARSATSGRGYYDFSFNVDGEVRRVRRYTTTFIADRSVRLLESFERDDDRPWLLFVFPHAPHAPFTAERMYEEAPVDGWDGNPAVRERNKSDKPEYVQNADATLAEGQDVREKQLRTLFSVDDLVAEVFASLDGLDESADTLSFFGSDNGYLWSEHGLKGKGWPYTPSTRVPLFMRWPGTVGARATDERLAGLIDIAPTIYDASGVAPAIDPDGRSLLEEWERSAILAEGWKGWGRWVSSITPSYQYIEYRDQDTNETTFRELYPAADRWQLTNLFEDADPGNDPSPAERARLAAEVAALESCAGREGPAACP
jgi:arylsulfatase A-like enzyme